MPRKCSICTHPKREEIERAMLQGEPYRRISTDFDASEEALRRHKKNDHIAEALVKSAQAKEITGADNSIMRIMGWLDEIKLIFHEAKAEGERGLALSASDKGLRGEELLAKVTKLINESPQINVGVQVNVADLSGKTIDFIKKNRLYKKFTAYMEKIYDAERS